MLKLLQKLFANRQQSSTKQPTKTLTQAPDLALYHFGFCPYCRMVRNKIKQLSLAIELRDIHQSNQHLQELVKGGGKKTVPCLQITTDDGKVTWLYESTDIVAYLDKRFG